MPDEQIVTPEPVSVEEPVSQEDASVEVSQEGAKPEVQPLTPEVQALINKSVAAAIARESDQAKKEIQSAKDRARNEVEQAQKRARFAEERLNKVKGGYEGLDPEVRERFELEDSKTQLSYYKQRELDEATRRNAEEYVKKLETSLANHLKEVGVDPSDSRIDWATDESNFLVGRERFDKSVAKILKEKGSASQKAMDDKFKELERNLRKELGVDSPDTTIASGVKKEDGLEARYPTMK